MSIVEPVREIIAALSSMPVQYKTTTGTKIGNRPAT